MIMIIAGYQVKEKIFESRNSLVYRALHEAQNQTVILKMLKQAYPPPETIAWFKREYELLRGLSVAGVIDVYGLTTDQNHPVMVLEDFGGESLELLMRARPFPLTECLQMAIQIVTILGRVHEHGIIHKDINPSNIVLNPTTGQMKLIDFGISTALTRENLILCDPSELEGTLAYISPEQTGRMNRAVDYRTDLYSLGATLYELFTGQLPFPTIDALALVHAHIAQQPTLPHTLVPDIPPPLSAIIMQLMSKNAEDRYQSAYGVEADLQECLQQWQTTGKISSFLPSQRDITDRFHIPQKLYGREPEIRRLLATFERVSQGTCGIVLVAGHAGVGKSAFVHEIYKPITQQRGYFISGKFDQLQRDIPYASLTQAFRSLIRQILTESKAQIATWCEKLLTALGPNGQVIVNVIPEVEFLVGPQQEVPALPPVESRNRFNLVFQNFIRVFTRPEHPLVLFLDDLQWADAASLSLLQHLLTISDNAYLFIIGAYRDNEVSETHPLIMVANEIQKTRGIVDHIALKPLGLHHINQLIADTLSCGPERADSLATLVLRKTNGNPFFIKEFLQELHIEKLLVFDLRSAEWKWDSAQIQTREITDNVVELLANKVQNLAGETQKILKLAACIGSQFDLHILAAISNKSPHEIAINLWSSIVEGMILPLDKAYKIISLDVQGLMDTIQVEYKFAHDRIQQAIYSLIPEREKRVVHRRIGQLLLSHKLTDKNEQKIFTIVNQLNLSLDHINRQTEWNELAKLNLIAGQKAKAAAAYKSALRYFRVGLRLLREGGWEDHYDLTLSLHIEAAEASYLNADFEQMERLSEILLQRAKTLLDKVRVYEINLHAYTAQDKLQEGIKTGTKVLKLLDINLPENPTQRDMDDAIEETHRIVANKGIVELSRLAEMTDPYKLAAMRIFSSMMHMTKVGSPRLFLLVALRMTNLSVIGGNSPLSAQAYAVYGLILCGIVEDIDKGNQFGELALNLIDRFNSQNLKASIIYIVESFIKPWKGHVRDTLKPLLEGYQIGLETGDLNFAALSTFGYIFKAYWIGEELTELEQRIIQYNNTIKQFKQDFIVDLNQLYGQVVLNFLGKSKDPCRLVGESFDEDQMLALCLKANHRTMICQIYINKMALCYMFNNYFAAVEYADRAKEYLDGLVGTIAIPYFYLYDSLARLAILSRVQESERKGILKKVVINQEKISLWMKHAPMNHLHKFYLVEAEFACALGNDSEAREYYDQAVDLAKEYGYINQEALANELAANFYLSRGRMRIAHHYLHDAHYAYLRWGAKAKVKDLESRYPQFLTSATTNLPWTADSASETDTRPGFSNPFDFISILKASQAIWGEIVLDKLLITLMRIVIENAGAQRGFLILEKDGQLAIEAEGIASKNEVAILQSIPIETYPDIPLTIIRYVERTKEKVVLSDATREEIFATDSYVAKVQPKSILCIPLIRQGQLTGVLYLENNLATGAFTPDRIEILNILSAEAAISIENARLYKSREEANKQLANYSGTLKQQVAQQTQALREKNHALELANNQVQEANLRKTQFLAGMSHELRTPMTAIIGFTRLVLRKAGNLLPDRQRENLRKVHESADHLLSLINDLLDLAKIEAGRMEVRPESFDVKQLIRSCCETVSPLLRPEVQLALDISDEVGEAYTDEVGLRHIVTNLLSNAVKFTETGVVEITIVVEDRANSPVSLIVAVSDTGMGIPVDALDTIFEEFQQVEGGKNKRKGTGLGLSIAKKWADMLGGSLEVESELGKGSTFTLRIPIVYIQQ